MSEIFHNNNGNKGDALVVYISEIMCTVARECVQ